MSIIKSYNEELEKIAVGLRELRAAYKSNIKSKLLRRAHKTAPGGTPLALPTSESPAQLLATLKGAGLSPSRDMLLKLHKQRRVLYTPQVGGGRIFAKGDSGRSLEKGRDMLSIPHFTSPKTPAGKEFFNRAVLSHEASELGKHYGPQRFASHISTRPLFHDLNIAATATGPGAKGAKKALLKLRQGEITELTALMPELKRLDLGNQRISRHATKRLQQNYGKRIAALREDPKAAAEFMKRLNEKYEKLRKAQSAGR